MDMLTIIGIIIGAVMIFFGIQAGGSIQNFIDLGGMMFTLGGMVAALMINFPATTIGDIFKYIKKAVFPENISPTAYIEMIVEIAVEARRNGLLALESKIDFYDDPFLKSGLSLMVDAHEPDDLRRTLETEISFAEKRHQKGQAFFEKAAHYATGFGMLGTLIGLINLLRKMEVGSSLGPGLGLALVTTFYGALIANLICIPIAGKLKLRDADERLCKQIMVEGMLAIQAGENPTRIHEKLLSYLSPKQRQTQWLSD